MMRPLFLLFATISAPTAAQLMPPAGSSQWNPAAAYITAGQDEPGYRRWYLSSPVRPIAVTSFNNYLTQYQVGGIVPTWQLLRTATSWHRCGAQPFEVPPVAEWPNIVQTLRYVHAYVIPAIGPVEPVSAYRNPGLNQCAGGAPESAHKHYAAIDMVPLQPTSRDQLMRTLCAVHARQAGASYDVGLGFYAFLRFHVDTTKYRRWGGESAPCPIPVQPMIIASPQPVAPAVAPAPVAAPAPAPAATVPPPEAAPVDPLAPTPSTTPPQP